MNERLELLAKQIARDIICLGDELPKKCYRIQFKLGSSRDESSGGGLNEFALANVILSTLRRMEVRQ